MKPYYVFFLLVLIGCKQPEISKESAQVVIEQKNESSTEYSFYERSFQGNCSHQNVSKQLGIGLIITPQKFTIYKDSLLKKRFFEIDTYEANELSELVCPKFFDPQYGVMHFVCIAETNKAYKILINFNEEGFLPKNKDFSFVDWPNYILKSIIYLKRFSDTIPSLYENPNTESTIIEIPSNQLVFCPILVKGDWLQIQLNCAEEVDVTKNLDLEYCNKTEQTCELGQTAWLQWRSEGDLLVDLFFENQR